MDKKLIEMLAIVVKHALAAAAKAHVWHLTEPSGYRHTVLGELYEMFHEIADTLSEPCQGASSFSPLVGQNKFQVNFDDATNAQKGIAEFLESLEKVRVQANSSGPDWLASEIEQIQAKLNSVVFRLNLK